MTHIVFCLPGREFSAQFFNSWNSTLAALSQAKISFQYSTFYNPIVSMCRNAILGGTNRADKYQVPFQGNVPYTHLMWIDSDVVWKPEDIFKLIELDVPVASGCYIMADNNHYPIVENMNDQDLIEKGSYEFLSRADLDTKKSPFNVGYVGAGFLLVKYGVFEQLNYPWFQTPILDIPGPEYTITDIRSEDADWCVRVRELGYDIVVHPEVRVGHQKLVTLG